MRETALVTGASSGIGADLARLFAKDGNDVVLVARSEEKLQSLAAALGREFNVTARVIVADLAKPDAAQDVVDALGGVTIDTLVNNAGYGVAGPFAETDVNAELQMIQVNVVALTHLTKLLLPGMLARKHGRILNVASTAAFQPGPLMAVYYATKAYVLSFTEALAEEVSGSGVTVTALCPGPTATGFAAAADMESSRLFNMLPLMTSEKVAAYGYRALRRGKRIAIPGVRNRLMAQSLRVSPRRLVTKIVRRMQEKT